MPRQAVVPEPGATVNDDQSACRKSRSSPSCVQRTRSKLPSATGRCSADAARSAAGLSRSTPTYSLARSASNGRYGLTPQPTSSTRNPPGSRSAAAAASASSHATSGASAAYVGALRRTLRRPSPGHSAAARIVRPSGGSADQPDAEPGQRVERDSGDEPDAVPDASRDDEPEQPCDAREHERRRRAHGRAP